MSSIATRGVGTVFAVVPIVLLPACSSDSRPRETSTSTVLPSPRSQTTKDPETALALGARQNIAELMPTPEGEPGSGVQLSVAELAAGDLTGDGHPDLVITYLRWSSVQTYPLSILVGDGQGHLRDATAELFEGRVPRTQHPRQTVLADFNGDRRLDVFVADTGVDVEPFPGFLSTLVLSSPDGRYVDATTTVPQRPAYTHCAAAGDVDGDGDVDLFLGQSPPQLLINDGRGRFSEGARLPARFGASGVLTRAEFADVDGDGDADLVLLGDGMEPAVLLNDGDGSFSERADALPVRPFADDAIGTAIEPLDLDGDEHLDLMVAWTKRAPFYKGRWVQTLVGNGDGSFRDETSRRLPQSTNDDQWIYDLVPGDVDGDGITDLGMDLGPTFADPAHSLPPPFLLGRGDGTFVLVPTTSDDPPYGQFRLVDLDGDGRTDVVSAWADPSRGVTVGVSSGAS